jgi:uncharacterized protein (DUF2336 family)
MDARQARPPICGDSAPAVQAPNAPRATLFDQLEQAISHSSPSNCAEMLRHITDLLSGGLAKFSDAQVALLDEVILRLASRVDASAKSTLARRLVSAARIPFKTIGMLANDDDIEVASFVLLYAEQLNSSTLIQTAQTKTQQHLLAIGSRKSVDQSVSDVLIARGNNDVLRRLVNNPGAKISDVGFQLLVQQCDGDDVLASVLGSRTDVPHHIFQKLFATSSEIVRANFIAANIPLKRAYSLSEPFFVFSSNGQALLAG